MRHALMNVAAALLCVGVAGAALAQKGSGVIIHTEADPLIVPEVPDAPSAAEAASSSRYGVGKAKLPPPADAACVSETELEAALSGSGCDCSCEEYARAPGRRCMTACGLAYYACWAPDPSEAEIRAQVSAVYAELEPAVRDTMLAQLNDSPEFLPAARGQLMLQRAQQWEEARRCPATN